MKTNEMKLENGNFVLSITRDGEILHDKVVGEWHEGKFIFTFECGSVLPITELSSEATITPD